MKQLTTLPLLTLALVGLTNPTTARAERPSQPPQVRTIRIHELTLARAVAARKPVGAARRFPANGKRIYAFVRATNLSTEASALRVVWRKGRKIYHSTTLRVGASKRRGWRTWAYLTARSSHAGAWSVAIEDTKGHELLRKAFTIEAKGRQHSARSSARSSVASIAN